MTKPVSSQNHSPNSHAQQGHPEQNLSEQSQPEGLTETQVQAALQQFGPNLLPSPPLPGKAKIFVRQFLSPFIYMLVVAAVVSFGLGQMASGIFILVVLGVNASIGFLQEYSAQQAAAALRNMVRGAVQVIRAGRQITLDSEAIVPGDVVLLASGDKVPADVRLISSGDLLVDESSLTGESLAVAKDATRQSDMDAALTDRADWLFAGTLITRGRAVARVEYTGVETQIGKIADEVLAPRKSRPPLLIRIDRFTYQVAFIILVAIALLAVLMVVKGGYAWAAIFLMAVGLAVSVIPEGLPAALTVALAIGMRRMADSHVIIRRLVAVEALGSCTFICSDKTGTLTVNELTVQKIVLPDQREFSVTGEGIAPGGEVVDASDDVAVKALVTAGVFANESQLLYSGGDWVIRGDIVDVAFLVLAKKLGLKVSQLQAEPCLKLIPYESEQAFSASLQSLSGVPTFFLKGSPEKVLTMCTAMQVGDRQLPLDVERMMLQVEAHASQGLRMIALAAGPGRVDDATPKALVFLGMVGMIDPVRASARVAVAQCLSGGIAVAMVTGDHPATARAIAAQLGLCDRDALVVTGEMLRARMEAGAEPDCPAPGSELAHLIERARVFARIEPKQKELIVKVFMQAGHFVAVTGDGVNDAPAMRAANVSVAMGERGTDVARETADLIITDDNFASIVAGIREGRVVYNNIRKVIGLLVATGFSIILLFFLCVFAGLPMPMLAVQLLWLNLVANGLQDVALAFEPSEGHEAKQKPRAPKEPIFDRVMIEHILVAGCLMGVVAFGYAHAGIQSGLGEDDVRNQTLMLMVLFGNVHALNSRSEWQSIFRVPLRRNLFLLTAVPCAQLLHIGAMYTPGLKDVLGLSPISFTAWGQLLLGALSLLVVEEVHKMIIRKRRCFTRAGIR